MGDADKASKFKKIHAERYPTGPAGSSGQKQTPLRVEKIGRNDPCPCGSGKKYKKCCGA
jgi:uncharacterized protein YecA (UPF0149 family)